MSAATDERLGLALVTIARGAIGARLGFAREATPGHDALSAPGATFVTLFCREELRGCIGSLRASRPLGEDDVRERAQRAARSTIRASRRWRRSSSRRRRSSLAAVPSVSVLRGRGRVAGTPASGVTD
jgi:AMMECR1 domain-containing protein